MKIGILFDQIGGVLGDGDTSGGAADRQSYVQGDRNGGAHINVLRGGGKARSRHGEMVGIEGNVGNAKVSVRIGLHVIDVMADRVFEVHLGARHGGL